MDDLIERLRNELIAPEGYPVRPKSRAELTQERVEAADLIESLQADLEVARGALGRIADRAAKLRKGTDDWFELVEFEQVSRQALNTIGEK